MIFPNLQSNLNQGDRFEKAAFFVNFENLGLFKNFVERNVRATGTETMLSSFGVEMRMIFF